MRVGQTYREALALLKSCPLGQGWHISTRNLGKGRWEWVVVTERTTQ